MKRVAAIGLIVLIAAAGISGAGEKAKPVTIDVILWFDTEDYILPESDDAALNLATWLSEQGVHATFKVVGEKARVLEKRGRKDVLAALQKHEIGYHSNWHSIPPTPAQYLNECGWEDGIAEFTRREKPGFEDVARILGQRPTCYGQPGSSWAPQTHAALYQWGVPIYLDAGSHINLNGRPFWYGGVLNFYKLTHQLRTGLLQPQDAEEAEAKFAAAREQLLREGGGVVSIVYHPCEFVHKQFWDGVNFRKGANPPRERWQLPPVKTAAERQVAQDNFHRYILFLKRFPEVRFSTATQAAADYPDRAKQREYSLQDVLDLSELVMKQLREGGFSWTNWRNETLAPAELFWLFTQVALAVPEADQKGETRRFRLPAILWGPSQASELPFEKKGLPREDLQRTAREVLTFMQDRRQIPSVVWAGSQGMPPEQFMSFLTQYLYSRFCQTRKMEMPPLDSQFRLPELRAKNHVADDGPSLWKWVIFPEGFHAPRVMRMAKLQAWTLKPARFSPN
jgi:hypothetical protein